MMFHVKHPPTYKELMMKRDHFLLLRNAVRHFLDTDPEIYGVAEITRTEIDRETGDLLVTAQFGLGDRATVRTHRVTFKEETPDVPRETSQHVHDYKVIAAYPAGPDGETAAWKACSCGDSITEDSADG